MYSGCANQSAIEEKSSPEFNAKDAVQEILVRSRMGVCGPFARRLQDFGRQVFKTWCTESITLSHRLSISYFIRAMEVNAVTGGLSTSSSTSEINR